MVFISSLPRKGVGGRISEEALVRDYQKHWIRVGAPSSYLLNQESLDIMKFGKVDYMQCHII